MQRDQKEAIARNKQNAWIKRRLSPESKPVKRLGSNSSADKKRSPYFRFCKLMHTFLLSSALLKLPFFLKKDLRDKICQKNQKSATNVESLRTSLSYLSSLISQALRMWRCLLNVPKMSHFVPLQSKTTGFPWIKNFSFVVYCLSLSLAISWLRTANWYQQHLNEEGTVA